VGIVFLPRGGKVFSRRSEEGVAFLFKMFFLIQSEPVVAKKGVLCNIKTKLLKYECIGKNTIFLLYP
jgi:hypothetical protein